MKNTEQYWNQFQKTGDIGYYLLYKHAKEWEGKGDV